MNAIVNKLLLARDRFMPKMHLKQSGFRHSACGPYTKNIERMEKILRKLVIPDLFIKTNYSKVVFNLIWIMEVLKI